MNNALSLIRFAIDRRNRDWPRRTRTRTNKRARRPTTSKESTWALKGKGRGRDGVPLPLMSPLAARPLLLWVTLGSWCSPSTETSPWSP